MPAIFKKAVNWLGLVDDERYQDEPENARATRAAEPPFTETTAPMVVPDIPQAGTSQVVTAAAEPPNFPGDNSSTVFLNPNLLVTPTSYNNLRPVAERYQSRIVTIMDLRAMPVEEARRSIDFFSGMVFALQGSIKRLAKGVFLLVPQGAIADQLAIDAVLAELP